MPTPVTHYQLTLVRDVDADILLAKGTVLVTPLKPVGGSVDTGFGPIPLSAVILRGYVGDVCVGQAG